MRQFFSNQSSFSFTNYDILASQVQAELGKPSSMQPDKGKVSIYIDCSSTAEPAFEVAYSLCCLSSSFFLLSRKKFIHIFWVSSYYSSNINSKTNKSIDRTLLTRTAGILSLIKMDEIPQEQWIPLIAAFRVHSFPTIIL